jgi:hypothetical protein
MTLDTIAADWLSLLMIQKPLTIDETADEQAEVEAAKSRLSAGDRNALGTIKQQAKRLGKSDRKVSLKPWKYGPRVTFVEIPLSPAVRLETAS